MFCSEGGQFQRNGHIGMQRHQPLVEAGQLAAMVTGKRGELGVGHLAMTQHTVQTHLVVGQRIWPELMLGVGRYRVEYRQCLLRTSLAQAHGQAQQRALRDGTGSKAPTCPTNHCCATAWWT